MSASALSVGGPGSSIDLMIWGPAIAQGLVEPTGASIWVGIDAEAARLAPATLEDATTEDGRVVGAGFEIAIPARAVGLATMGRRRGLAAWITET